MNKCPRRCPSKIPDLLKSSVRADDQAGAVVIWSNPDPIFKFEVMGWNRIRPVIMRPNGVTEVDLDIRAGGGGTRVGA